LIRELSDKPGRCGQGSRVEWRNVKHRQFADEAEELDGAALIVAPEKPAVTFGDARAEVSKGGGEENSLLKTG